MFSIFLFSKIIFKDTTLLKMSKFRLFLEKLKIGYNFTENQN